MRVRLPRQCPQVRTNSSMQNSIDTLSVDGGRKTPPRRSGVSKLRDDNQTEHLLQSWRLHTLRPQYAALPESAARHLLYRTSHGCCCWWCCGWRCDAETLLRRCALLKEDGWGKLVRIIGCWTTRKVWAICPPTAHYTLPGHKLAIGTRLRSKQLMTTSPGVKKGSIDLEQKIRSV